MVFPHFWMPKDPFPVVKTQSLKKHVYSLFTPKLGTPVTQTPRSCVFLKDRRENNKQIKLNTLENRKNIYIMAQNETLRTIYENSVYVNTFVKFLSS